MPLLDTAVCPSPARADLLINKSTRRDLEGCEYIPKQWDAEVRLRYAAARHRAEQPQLAKGAQYSQAHAATSHHKQK